MASLCIELSPIVSPSVFLYRPSSLSRNPIVPSLSENPEYRRSRSKTPTGQNRRNSGYHPDGLGEESAYTSAAAAGAGSAAARREEEAEGRPGGRWAKQTAVAALRISRARAHRPAQRRRGCSHAR